jgi:hypothetical protein
VVARAEEVFDPSGDLLASVRKRRFGTILADPPWRFTNRTGKMAPEHKRLSRYGTLTLEQIVSLPVERVSADVAHLYLWVPNALLSEGLAVMKAWGFAASRDFPFRLHTLAYGLHQLHGLARRQSLVASLRGTEHGALRLGRIGRRRR